MRDLYEAVKTGNCEKARQLLLKSNHGINHVPRGQEGGRFPLRIACENGDLEMVKILLKNGANLSQISTFRDGKDGAIIGCAKYDSEILSFMIESLEGEITSCPIFYACENQDLQFARFLISKNCPVNGFYFYRHQTPLFVACKYQNIEMIKLLLKNGAKNTYQDESVLHTICGSSYVSLPVVQTLVESGVDVNLFCSGTTPLISASQAPSSSEQREVVEFLLKRGANITHVNQRCRNCLHVATARRNFLLVKILCEYGADIQAKDDQGRTPADVTSSLPLKKFLKEFILIDGSIKPAKREGEEEKEVVEEQVEEEEEKEGTKKRKNSQNESASNEIPKKKPRLEDS